MGICRRTDFFLEEPTGNGMQSCFGNTDSETRGFEGGEKTSFSLRTFLCHLNFRYLHFIVSPIF